MSIHCYKVAEYNLYGIVWAKDKIDFYVNDTIQYTYHRPADASSREWPFDQTFYLILNQSGAAGWPGPITDTDLPFKMDVDWVKVYQKKRKRQ